MNTKRLGLSGLIGGVLGAVNGWSLFSFTATTLFCYFFVFNWINKVEEVEG